jgi:hypothetical protein
MASADATTRRRERRLERLIERLPVRLRAPTRWLRQPASRWLRIPAGLLLVAGGFLSVLPLFGLWMLPLGLMLLSEDVPLLRRARERVLDWLERRHPHWFAETLRLPAPRDPATGHADEPPEEAGSKGISARRPASRPASC